MFLCLFLGCEEEDSVCDNEIDGLCYDNNDLSVLSDFRECSELFDDTTSVFDIGNQEWYSGRLTKLNLYYNQLTSLPESIGNLSSLEYLGLDVNQLTSLPESICDIPSSCVIRVHNNQLCEEYHYDCIDDWDPQDCDP